MFEEKRKKKVKYVVASINYRSREEIYFIPFFLDLFFFIGFFLPLLTNQVESSSCLVF